MADSFLTKLGKWGFKNKDGIDAVLTGTGNPIAAPFWRGYVGLWEEQNKTPESQPALPDITDDAVQAAKKRQALQVMQGRGRRSTFLTGPLGVPTEPVVGRRTLLGGM